MNSQYIKELEGEIKKRKIENDLSFNLAKLKIDKKKLKENLNNEKSRPKSEKKINISQNYEKKFNFNNSLNNNNSEKDETNSTIDVNESDDNKDKNNKKNNSFKYNFKNIHNHICQCCNKEFDSNKKIPFLLKCNHIFCKKCLENYFTDEEGIKCPIDGLMGKSINDIKILNISSDLYNNNTNEESLNINKNRNYINYSINAKSKSYKELIRNKPKDLNTKNNYSLNTYDKIRNYITNDNNNNNNLNQTNLTNRKKKSFNKLYTMNNSIKKHLNKNSSFIFNNNINISKINNSETYSKINLKEKENIQKTENSEEYYDQECIQNFCNIHPEQKITHFVEDTKELICIYCAFNKLKNNPNILIKEIPEKCKEYLNDLDIIIENNKKCESIIQNSLNDINENKENEEKKLIEIYDQLINILVTNRNNYLIKIEEIFQENINNMNNKLNNFEEIIDIAIKLKEDFDTIYSKAPYEFNHLTQAFNKFIREINDKNNSDLEINQYNFSHDELNKVIIYLNNFADVKTRKKIFRFDLLKNSSNNASVKEINNTNNYNGFLNNINLYKNGINNYFINKQLNYTNKNNKKKLNNKKNNSNYRNNSNDIDIKNNSLIYKNNNNLKFKFKYEDDDYNNNNNNNNNKYSTLFNNSIFNNYVEANNNYNGSTSESINDTLNKYISSTNMIRDNLYNQAPLINFNNSKNRKNNSYNYNKGLFKEFKKNDKIEILNKYKIPIQKKK